MSWVSEVGHFLVDHGISVAAMTAWGTAVLFTGLAVGLKGISITLKLRKPKVRRRSFLLDLLLPMKLARDVQANLDEVTPIWVKAHGRRRAAVIRAAQIGRIIAGHHLRPLVRFFERVLKILRGKSAK
ncbi:MAG TPA: hypothetical protein VF603_10515 [Allosphingosinicella sp.]|jgi:hypothetical protein